jgi:alpha-N-arabinofuranosidase
VVDPGGYQWKHGIGPRDERAPFHNEVWGRIDTNEVGIDEFCRFCELVGAQPLICVSRRDGAQSAADLVEYCNGGPETAWAARRAANGHREPYRIRYWQLGNEVSSEDDASIRGVLDACRAIHAVDPGAQILTSYPSAPLIRAAAREIAFVAPHHYTRDLGACDAELRRLSDLMRASPETEHIRCAITEWNVTGGEWGLERGRQLSLDTAIRNARYLHLLMRHSDFVEIGCRSNMCNSLCSGIIATRAGALLRRPSFYVMKLYSDHALPVPLTVSGAPNGIDVVACASEDRHHACVFAVNTRTEPVPVTLELAGIITRPALAAESVCDTLDLRQPDALNNWARPDRVRTMSLAVNGNRVVLPALSVTAISY